MSFSTAHAGSVYLETGFGGSRIHSGKALYGSETPGSPGFGFAANGRLGWGISRTSAPLQFHLGLSHRLNNSSGEGMSFGTQATYFGFRLEGHRMNIGFGGSPLVWKQYGAGAGGSGIGFSRSLGTRAGMAEFNLLWRIIPDFLIAFGGGAEVFWTPQGVGPKPAWAATIQFRFILPYSDSKGGGSRPDGWRYPFGVPIF